MSKLLPEDRADIRRRVREYADKRLEVAARIASGFTPATFDSHSAAAKWALDLAELLISHNTARAADEYLRRVDERRAA